MKDLTANSGKFTDPETTADGKRRATVALERPETLWFNTGSLCNITCENCFMASSPSNDALVYITAAEVSSYLDQLEQRGWPVGEIGFTGGEPFMNPDMIAMTRAALDRGHEVLILTNAMRPMMRPVVRDGLAALIADHGDRLTLRISLDHWSKPCTTPNAAAAPLPAASRAWNGCATQGARMAVAGRTTGTRPTPSRAPVTRRFTRATASTSTPTTRR